jgi:hypothetical protein
LDDSSNDEQLFDDSSIVDVNDCSQSGTLKNYKIPEKTQKNA